MEAPAAVEPQGVRLQDGTRAQPAASIGRVVSHCSRAAGPEAPRYLANGTDGG